MNLDKLLFIAAFCLLGSACMADHYYVDSENGVDSRSGRSPELAWKTVDRAMGQYLQPGDSVLFRRGGVWREKFYISSSGAEGQPIYFGAYGDGEMPCITAVDAIEGWQDSTLWQPWAEGIWKLPLAFDPMRLLVDGTERLKNHTPQDIGQGNGDWCFAGGVLYLCSGANPATVFNAIEGNRLYYTLRIQNDHYIMLENLELAGGSGNTAALFGCHDVVIRGCRIGRWGWLGIRINPYYNQMSYHITIADNRIDSGFDFIYGPPECRGVEDGILLSAGVRDCLIQGNEVLDWGHTGIGMSALYEGDAGVYSNRAVNNYISGSHISYMRGIGTGGRENLCRDNEFAGNLIKDTTVRNQINGNRNRVHHNIIDGITNSPVKAGGTAQGFDLQGYGDGLVCHDNIIDHNTVMNCDEAGLRIRADENPKYGHLIRNNIFYNCGRNSKDGYRHCAIVIDSDASVKGSTFLNNCLYGQDVTRAVRYRGRILTVDVFNSLNGENGDTLAGNLWAEPQIDGSDYTLQPASDCIDAALALDYTADFYGNVMPQGAGPDIGACEYEAGTAVAETGPAGFHLAQNFPNPFNPVTTLTFTVPEDCRMTLSVCNILGQEVALLLDRRVTAGEHSVSFDGSGLASGIYFGRLTMDGGQNRCLKMVLSR